MEKGCSNTDCTISGILVIIAVVTGRNIAIAAITADKKYGYKNNAQ